MEPATVLVAEDSLVVRAVLKRDLEEHGYSVIEASDGEVALRMCEESSPDMVLLDIEMPGLDGHQVLTALKEDPQLSELPVVFLSGRTNTDDVVAGLALGAHDYLKKPFESAELIARVSAAVRVKRLQDQLRAHGDELERISRTDALTGLFNRRHLDERSQELADAARDAGRTLGVVMFDIDHFKSVNDTLGHSGGDLVLQEFATRMRNQLPSNAVCGRWGGEEFLVFLPETDQDRAMEFANRVGLAISGEPFAVGGDQTIEVTVSGGCALGDGDQPERTVREADAALYEAKENGRNRIVLAREPAEASTP